jgi:hypothetical protein
MAELRWRLYFPNSPAGGPGATGRINTVISGLQMRESIGGANACVGGATSASSFTALPGYVKSSDQAFVAWDGVNWWQSEYGLPASFPSWLEYQFAAPVEIEEIVLTGVAAAFGGVNPGRIVLQKSPDGVDWISKYFWETPTPWGTSGADTRTFNNANDVSGLFVPTARTLSLINFPTEQIQATALRPLSLIRELAVEIAVPQVRVLSLVRGRTKDPRVRAWTFSMDGHDFYVLRLGDTATLVYDLYSEQWVDWATLGLDFWRMNVGNNWSGGNRLATDKGSNVVVGDDTLGLIWFLDPNLPYDEHPRDTIDTPLYFERITQGQYPMKGRESLACYAAWLTADMGAPAYEGAAVKMEISDDAGRTYFDVGSVEVTLGVYEPQIAWYSLGQINAPGRLFRITDDGAVSRIDGLEMNDPDDAG